MYTQKHKDIMDFLHKLELRGRKKKKNGWNGINWIKPTFGKVCFWN